MTEQTTEVSVQEAINEYLRAAGDKDKGDVTADIARFSRWFGGEKPMRSLRPADIERYGEETSKSMDAERRLKCVRGFLEYARKQKLIDQNLTTHLRLRRTAGSDAGGETRNPEQIDVSREGLIALRGELESLINQRPEIADELRLARADGDIRENAPLDAAREKQAHMEARIRELEGTLKRAVVVDSSADGSDRARMGSRVRLVDLETKQERLYTLVGPGEVNAGQGRISVQSPVGRAVMDRSPGDEFEVAAPSGVKRFRLESVES